MKCVLRDGPGRIQVRDRSVPTASNKEVVVRVAYAGICGSDIHRLIDDHSRWNSIVLGHEFSGIVVSCGSEADSKLLGQHVAVAPLIPCHRCPNCFGGRFALCTTYSFIGSRRDGAFAEFVAVPESNLVPLPSTVSLKSAALLEPLTVVLHGLAQLGRPLSTEDSVLVIGLGAIGLLTVQVAKSLGVQQVIASDIVDAKLQLASKLGATVLWNASAPPGDNASTLRPTVVVECSGSAGGRHQAIRMAAGGGAVLLLGTSASSTTFDQELFDLILRKELSLKGSWMNYSAPWPGREWAEGLELLRSGSIYSETIITHEYPLLDAESAIQTVLGNTEPFVKVLLAMDTP